MNREVFITSALTGGMPVQDQSRHIPRSPKEIAESAIASAKAGAAIVHVHVRDPETGVPSRDLGLYREVTDRIRDSETDVILNLTGGHAGMLRLGSADAPLPLLKERIWQVLLSASNMPVYADQKFVRLTAEP